MHFRFLFKYLIIIPCFILVLFSSAAAGSILVDPQIPDGEEIIYKDKIGNKISEVKERVNNQTNNGRAVYEITSLSKDMDLAVLIDRSSLELIQSVMTQKTESIEVENTTKPLRNEIISTGNEIVIWDFVSLHYLLRGFPFGKIKTLKVRNFRNDNFSIEINWIEKTSMNINGRNILCDKLEMSLPGMWGMFFPKTVFWYSSEPPHYLVRYEGTSGGPGSPLRILELSEYSVK